MRYLYEDWNGESDSSDQVSIICLKGNNPLGVQRRYNQTSGKNHLTAIRRYNQSHKRYKQLMRRKNAGEKLSYS